MTNKQLNLLASLVYGLLRDACVLEGTLSVTIHEVGRKNFFGHADMISVYITADMYYSSIGLVPEYIDMINSNNVPLLASIITNKILRYQGKLEDKYDSYTR